MMSMMVSFCAVLFPFFVLDGTLDPVSGGGGGGGGGSYLLFQISFNLILFVGALRI